MPGSQEIGGINVKIRADASELRKDFNSLKTESQKNARDIGDAFNRNIKSGFDGVNLSVGELKTRLGDLNQKMDQLSKVTGISVAQLEKVGSGRIRDSYQGIKNEIQQVTNEMNRLKYSGDNVEKTQNGLTAAQRRSNYAGISAIGIVSDLQYGYRGVMNNIQQTVTQLSYLAQAQDVNTGKALGYSGALKTMGAGLIGTNGVLLGIMAVTTALGFLLNTSNKSSDSIENLTQDTKDLNEQLRLLKGNFDDIVQGAKNTRDTLLKGGIAEQEQLIKTYRDLLGAGGVTGANGLFMPFNQAQINLYTNAIDKAQQKIDDYYKQLQKGNEFSNTNIDLLKKLAAVASTEGVAGVKKFAIENQLSEGQLKDLIKQLNYYKENVLAISGGLAKELAPGIRETAIQLGLQSDETKAALDVLNKYFKKIKDVSTIPKFEFQFDNKTLNVEPIKRQLESQHLEWNEKKGAYEIKYTYTDLPQISPIPTTDILKQGETNPFFKSDYWKNFLHDQNEANRGMKDIYQGAIDVGRALDDAFSKGGDNLLSKLSRAFTIAVEIAKTISQMNKASGDKTGGILSIFGNAIGFLSILAAQSGGEFVNNSGVLSKIPKYATGTNKNFIVGAAGLYDGALLRVDTGEKVSVTPANQVGVNDTNQLIKRIDILNTNLTEGFIGLARMKQIPIPIYGQIDNDTIYLSNKKAAKKINRMS